MNRGTLMHKLGWISIALALLAPAARATVPKQFSVQGVLRDKNGALLTNMSVPVIVKFFDAQAMGNQLGSDYNLGTLTLSNGLFTVAVAAPTIFTDFAAAASVWMEMTVNGEIYSRQQVTPEIYSLMCSQADNAASLGGVAAASYLTTATAASTYLTQTNATATYLPKTGVAADSAKLGNVAAASYLTSAVASMVYLTQMAASMMYLPINGQAADSRNLGTLPASTYQHILAPPDCNPGSFIQAITPSGAVTCVPFVAQQPFVYQPGSAGLQLQGFIPIPFGGNRYGGTFTVEFNFPPGGSPTQQCRNMGPNGNCVAPNFLAGNGCGCPPPMMPNEPSYTPQVTIGSFDQQTNTLDCQWTCVR
jgi:hypothetical protein